MTAYSHEFSTSLPAPPSAVFRALTEADALRQWFAEQVEIDPRPGGSFRFWGRHSYDTARAEQADQMLRVFEPPHRLAFSWRLHGIDTEVEFSLAEDERPDQAGGTRLTIRHRLDRLPAIGRARELIDDLWRLHAGNLQSHLGGGAGISLPDFSDPSPEVRASILIDGPVERVFAAFLDPALLNRWIASAAEVEPRAGGRYRYGWHYQIDGRDVEGGPSRILELVENRKLVTDWPDWRGDAEVPVQRVTWLFEPLDAQTRVTIVHDGFTRAVDISDYPFGWPYFLSALKPVAEGAVDNVA